MKSNAYFFDLNTFRETHCGHHRFLCDNGLTSVRSHRENDIVTEDFATAIDEQQKDAPTVLL